MNLFASSRTPLATAGQRVKPIPGRNAVPLANPPTKVSSLALRIASRSQCWMRATSVRNTSSNAGSRARMLSLVPAGAHRRTIRGVPASRLHFNPCPYGTSYGRRCGHRAAFCGNRTSFSAALSLPARATDALTSSGAGSAVEPAWLSNAPRARRPAPQSMPLRGEWWDAPQAPPTR